jgi:hypothetical protein
MASPPFNPAETLPGDTDVVLQFPAVERAFRDIIESWLLFEHGRSGHHAFPVISTGARDSDTTWEAGSLIYNSTLGKLQVTSSIDPDVWVSVGPEFPSGTRMPFQQTTPPTGWTKESAAAYNDAVMGLTTGSVGTAGTTAIGSVFAARTITQANLPDINLTAEGPTLGISYRTDNRGDPGGTDVMMELALGTGFAHDIDLTHTHVVPLGGDGEAMDFDVKRASFTIGTKV